MEKSGRRDGLIYDGSLKQIRQIYRGTMTSCVHPLWYPAIFSRVPLPTIKYRFDLLPSLLRHRSIFFFHPRPIIWNLANEIPSLSTSSRRSSRTILLMERYNRGLGDRSDTEWSWIQVPDDQVNSYSVSSSWTLLMSSFFWEERF